MKATMLARTYILCPHCGEGENRVDHLFDQQEQDRDFGPWSCGECGGSYSGIVRPDRSIDLVLREERRDRTYDLLVLPPQEKPVYFLIRGSQYESHKEPLGTGKKYSYEEHSCPTNWLPNIEVLAIGDDDDPHGLLQYVRSVYVKDCICVDNGLGDPDIFKNFPEVLA